MPDKTEEQILEEQQKAEELEEYNLNHSIREILGLPSGSGKLVFSWILEICKIMDVEMTGNSFVYFNLGKANVGKQIFNRILDIDPDAISLIFTARRDGLWHKKKE